MQYGCSDLNLTAIETGLASLGALAAHLDEISERLSAAVQLIPGVSGRLIVTGLESPGTLVQSWRRSSLPRLPRNSPIRRCTFGS